MTKQVIIATRNKGKVRDFEQMFAKKDMTVKSLLDYDDIPEIEETGTTFEENAKIKAETLASALGEAVIADDSGLIIDALGGRPGVYSARYAGVGASDQDNYEKVLQEMTDVPAEDRTARFKCVIALAMPGGETEYFSGTCEGLIIKEPIGVNGFGYDPIMYIEEYQKTMAELSTTDKNKISHRRNALDKLLASWG